MLPFLLKADADLGYRHYCFSRHIRIDEERLGAGLAMRRICYHSRFLSD